MFYFCLLSSLKFTQANLRHSPGYEPQNFYDRLTRWVES